MTDTESGGSGHERVLVLAVTTAPSCRREMLLALDEFRRRALSEPGCIACELLEDVSATNRFVWMERWRDRAQADLAVTRPRFRGLLGAVKLLGELENLDWLSRRDGPAVDAADRRGEGDV